MGWPARISISVVTVNNKILRPTFSFEKQKPENANLEKNPFTNPFSAELKPCIAPLTKIYFRHNQFFLALFLAKNFSLKLSKVKMPLRQFLEKSNVVIQFSLEFMRL